MATSDVKPTIGLDLDTIEEDGALRTPYEFTAGGEKFIAYDPDRLDWTTIATLDNEDPRDLLRVYLEVEDYTRFLLLDPTPKTWRIKRLIGALNTHFFGAAKPAGESPALPAS